MVLGRNSATRRIIVVEIKVFTISIRRSEPRTGERRFREDFGKYQAIYYQGQSCSLSAS